MALEINAKPETAVEMRARLRAGELRDSERAALAKVHSGVDRRSVYATLEWRIAARERYEQDFDLEVGQIFGSLRHMPRDVVVEKLSLALCRDSGQPWRAMPDSVTCAQLAGLSDDEVDALAERLAQELPPLAEAELARRHAENPTLGQRFPSLSPIWAVCKRDMSWAGVDRKVGDIVDLAEGRWAPGKLAWTLDSAVPQFVVLPDYIDKAGRAAALNRGAPAGAPNVTAAIREAVEEGSDESSEPLQETPEERRLRKQRERTARSRQRKAAEAAR